ncbi:hypothetical protein MMC34_008483 [Xylographa carneopallida]|nr:hypothetical protein [Xylographa carneopallida]
MTTPVEELSEPRFEPSHLVTSRSSDEENTYIGDETVERATNYRVLSTSDDSQQYFYSQPSPSQTRAQESQLDDDLTLLHAERVVSHAREGRLGIPLNPSISVSRSKSRRSDNVDEFDIATNPVHEKTALYRPPDRPKTTLAKLFKKIHDSSSLVRYFTYITPIVIILLVPLLLGALVFKNATVGGVELIWFSVWLELVWLTLWAGRVIQILPSRVARTNDRDQIVAKMIPWPLGLVSSLFTNNSKKWRDMGKQLEVPATIFFWWLAVEISFLPIMNNHILNGYTGDGTWKKTGNTIIVSIFIGATLNFAEKIIIQLIAISFHLRTYADRIEVNKFQINSLVKLYQYSKDKISLEDSEFEEGGRSGPASGARTPAQIIEKAQKNVAQVFNKVGDVAGKVAGDFTGKQVTKSTHPHQVVLMLLNSTSGSQVLARRLFRTFVREGTETVYSEDMKNAFDNDEEADAAFSMFDKDLNGDISIEELESVCVEIGRERKSITASLKDLDSVISKLDGILLFVVICVTILIFISLISTSAAGVLTSAGSTVLALSWLLSATAQEFLQSIIFVFVKHPFDVGDRVTIYGNTGAAMKGDDYFVKEISLLFTEFKKMEGHVVQAPNSYLNTLFILNMRRSGGLAEAVPLTVKFGTTLEQIDELRSRLLEFVKEEKREYQGNILTEIRDVVEAHAVNLNVVFFYKSNWQNEGLRLQRRNKFICALMVSMQAAGIEGPRMRLPGQKEGIPFHVQHPSSHPIASDVEAGPGLQPESGFVARDARDIPFVPATSDMFRNHSSTYRSGSILNRGGRQRGESVSSMSKRVDFSLGMKDVSASNMMADVYDDNPHIRLPEISKSSFPRSRNVPNHQVVQEEDEDEKTGLGRTTSRLSRDGDSRSRFGLHRSSTESHSRLNKPYSTIHKNRFFGRRGRATDGDSAEEDLMEQGMADIPESRPVSAKLDPRTGLVSTEAIKIETSSSDEVGSLSTWESRDVGKLLERTGVENFEMRRLM